MNFESLAIIGAFAVMAGVILYFRRSVVRVPAKLQDAPIDLLIFPSPLRVKIGSQSRCEAGPIFPGKQTYRRQLHSSASGHLQTHAPQQTTCHSISWSALRSRDSEIVSPRFLAVLKLITSANLVGCWTGRREGLTPFKILST